MTNGRKTLSDRMLIVETKLDTIKSDTEDLKEIMKSYLKQSIEIEKIKIKAETNRWLIGGVLFLLLGLVIKSFL